MSDQAEVDCSFKNLRAGVWPLFKIYVIPGILLLFAAIDVLALIQAACFVMGRVTNQCESSEWGSWWLFSELSHEALECSSSGFWPFLGVFILTLMVIFMLCHVGELTCKLGAEKLAQDAQR
ncbi:hypothetical protein ACYPKM_01750 [Pseudomonas aeruginosa]